MNQLKEIDILEDNLELFLSFLLLIKGRLVLITLQRRNSPKRAFISESRYAFLTGFFLPRIFLPFLSLGGKCS